NSDGVPDLTVVPSLQINGLPVAGNFTNAPATAPNIPARSEIGVFDGAGNWYLDTNANNNIDGGDTVVHDSLRGFPIVGDFDGNGSFDLATYRPDLDTFFFDLNPLGGPRAFPTIHFGFVGVNERPVAADMDKDGVTDIGLWMPNRFGSTPTDTAEWYFLVSGGNSAPAHSHGPPVAGTVNTLNHAFSPTPLGTDLFFKFGGLPAAPIVGLFDPPVLSSLGVADPYAGTTPAPTTAATAPAHRKKHRKGEHGQPAKHVKHPVRVRHGSHTKTTHRNRSAHRTAHRQAKAEQQGMALPLSSMTISPLPGAEQ